MTWSWAIAALSYPGAWVFTPDSEIERVYGPQSYPEALVPQQIQIANSHIQNQLRKDPIQMAAKSANAKKTSVVVDTDEGKTFSETEIEDGDDALESILDENEEELLSVDDEDEEPVTLADLRKGQSPEMNEIKNQLIAFHARFDEQLEKIDGYAEGTTATIDSLGSHLEAGLATVSSEVAALQKDIHGIKKLLETLNNAVILGNADAHKAQVSKPATAATEAPKKGAEKTAKPPAAEPEPSPAPAATEKVVLKKKRVDLVEGWLKSVVKAGESVKPATLLKFANKEAAEKEFETFSEAELVGCGKHLKAYRKDAAKEGNGDDGMRFFSLK